MNIAAFDYSITCPSLCFQNLNGFLEFHFVTSTVKVQDNFYTDRMIFRGHPYPDYSTQEERYHKISETFIDNLLINHVELVVFEGFSMGSKGKVFNIAENAAVMKHKLFLCNIKIEEYAPTTIKKFAGKGNFDKFQMYEAWYARTGINLYDVFGLKESTSKVPSPIQDVVDSFFVYTFAQSVKN